VSAARRVPPARRPALQWLAFALILLPGAALPAALGAASSAAALALLGLVVAGMLLAIAVS
jgi:hypothetical protein